jgi:predicted Ser/Thr protein kinase
MAQYNDIGSLPAALVGTLKEHRVTRSLRRQSRVFTDTTDFTSIDYGDIIQVEDRYFLITSYTREGRFGVDEQVKQWVPKVEELATGVSYIIKLVFHETFDITLGQFTIPCYRSPEKEARILELVQGRPHFMQGELLLDAAGNLVRVIVPVNGNRLDKVIQRSERSHQAYFFEELPGILAHFLDAMQAIGFLHEHGFRHGDIRRDHVFVDRHSGVYHWIDFDYEFYLPEKPFALDLLELGNILIYLIGKGDYNPRQILADPTLGDAVLQSLVPADFALLSQNKVVNLRKIFPYVPEKLNNVLLHFATGAEVFYDTVEELHRDLSDALGEMVP